MTFRSIALGAALVTFFAPAVHAGGDNSNRNQVLEEMRQVQTGDYSYRVDHYGRILPRYDQTGGIVHGQRFSPAPYQLFVPGTPYRQVRPSR